jgi:hypothetical protein
VTKKYWEEVYEKDQGQETTNVHILARRQFNSDLPVTPEIINTVLKLTGTSDTITTDHLKMFSEIKPVDLGKCPLSPEMELKRLKLFGSVRTKPGDPQRVAGAYVFTHIKSGEQVVGSSVSLAERTQQHIRLNTGGAVGAAFKLHKVENFTLTIYPLPKEFQTKSMALALEQWLFFTLKPSLNILLVANSASTNLIPAGKTGSKIKGTQAYLYYQGKLIYIAQSLVGLSSVMGQASRGACWNIVNYFEGIYLRDFKITLERIEGAQESLLTAQEVRELVERVQQTGQRSSARTPTNVTYFQVTYPDGRKSEILQGAEAVRTFLKKEIERAPDLKKTRNLSQTGKPYYGFIITTCPSPVPRVPFSKNK